MSPAVKTIMWIAMAVVALIVIVIAWGGWMMFRRPLTMDAHMSRYALSKAGLTKNTVDTPGGAMTYWEGGSGPTMVLLHGAGDQAGAWARIVTRLLPEYRLLIPDLPGHWGSPPKSGPTRSIASGVITKTTGSAIRSFLLVGAK